MIFSCRTNTRALYKQLKLRAKLNYDFMLIITELIIAWRTRDKTNDHFTHTHTIRNLNFVHIFLGSMRPGILSYLQQKRKRSVGNGMSFVYQY